MEAKWKQARSTRENGDSKTVEFQLIVGYMDRP
jgi:hypothetical protein